MYDTSKPEHQLEAQKPHKKRGIAGDSATFLEFKSYRRRLKTIRDHTTVRF
jgi:hypothetical protein